MPGPFPGMDPYLEDPAYWHGFHNRLIGYASEALNTSLPGGFVADIEERLYVVESNRSIYPDVSVLRRPPPQNAPQAQGATALTEQADPSGVLTALPMEMHEWFVEIRTTAKPRRIITILEILSPANKAPGSEGRQDYLQKQREILHSDTNLLEIDLLRRGAHTVAAPYDHLIQEGTWDYLVCLHRSRQRYRYEFWMNHLRDRLPRVYVPLTAEYPDAILDLQAVFTRAYEAGRYLEDIDYLQALSPPLEKDTAQWAEALLRTKGLRS